MSYRNNFDLDRSPPESVLATLQAHRLHYEIPVYGINKITI